MFRKPPPHAQVGDCNGCISVDLTVATKEGAAPLEGLGLKLDVPDDPAKLMELMRSISSDTFSPIGCRLRGYASVVGWAAPLYEEVPAHLGRSQICRLYQAIEISRLSAIGRGESPAAKRFPPTSIIDAYYG